MLCMLQKGCVVHIFGLILIGTHVVGRLMDQFVVGYMCTVGRLGIYSSIHLQSEAMISGGWNWLGPSFFRQTGDLSHPLQNSSLPKQCPGGGRCMSSFHFTQRRDHISSLSCGVLGAWMFRIVSVRPLCHGTLIIRAHPGSIRTFECAQHPQIFC